MTPCSTSSPPNLFAAELTETLPPDDPMIIEVRYWLRRMRDTAREHDDGPNT